MTSFQRLVKRLQDDGRKVPDGLIVHRTYAGHWQRSAGAWSWYASDQLGREIIASQYPITDLLKADSIAVGNDDYGDALVLYPEAA